MLRRTRLKVEGLNAYRVAEKLDRAGISVYFLKKTQKNAVILEVASKDVKKTFAILRDSCYNIKKVFPVGFSRLLKLGQRRIGLLGGALLFVLLVTAAQTRILRIDVVGGGAYLSETVRSILTKEGITVLSPVPKENGSVTAQILSLDGVSFCTVSTRGGILTVEVETSEEHSVITPQALISPCDGVVEEIVLLRGTACVAVGQTVERGDVLVDCLEGERKVLVMTRVRIRCEIEAEYEAVEESEARALAAAEYGEISSLSTEKTSSGWRLRGFVTQTVAMNEP